MPVPKRVYLDQNKWIDLAKCRLGREDGDRSRDVLDVLRHGVEHGLVSCPLSAQHYMETARRNNATSRHDLAITMAELSKFHTIAPAKAVVPMELDSALRDRFGRPQTPRAAPNLRYRIPPRLPVGAPAVRGPRGPSGPSLK